MDVSQTFELLLSRPFTCMAAYHCEERGSLSLCDRPPLPGPFLALGLFLVVPGQCPRRRHSCKALPVQEDLLFQEGCVIFCAMNYGYLDTRAKEG